MASPGLRHARILVKRVGPVIFLAFALLPGGSPGTLAQAPTIGKQPVVITADSLRHDEQGGRTVATGNVQVTQGGRDRPRRQGCLRPPGRPGDGAGQRVDRRAGRRNGVRRPGRAVRGLARRGDRAFPHAVSGRFPPRRQRRNAYRRPKDRNGQGRLFAMQTLRRGSDESAAVAAEGPQGDPRLENPRYRISRRLAGDLRGCRCSTRPIFPIPIRRSSGAAGSWRRPSGPESSAAPGS